MIAKTYQRSTKKLPVKTIIFENGGEINFEESNCDEKYQGSPNPIMIFPDEDEKGANNER